MNRLFSLAVLMVALVGASSAQETLLEAPTPKHSARVFDASTKIELSLVAASLAADSISGLRFQSSAESNPALRSLESRLGNGGDALYFGAMFGADVAMTYMLRRTHHQRIAHIMNLAVIGMETGLAIKNTRTRLFTDPVNTDATCHSLSACKVVTR